MSTMEEVDVFDLIERMAALIRSEERKKCTEFGLQAVHMQVLNYVSRCNKYSDTPAALTSYLGMTSGTVSQTLSLLTKKGYVKKTADTRDRRVVHLELSPEGRTLENKLNQRLTKYLYKQTISCFIFSKGIVDQRQVFSDQPSDAFTELSFAEESEKPRKMREGAFRK